MLVENIVYNRISYRQFRRVEAMQALRGYYNGKVFIPLEKVNVKANQKVIITVLDEYLEAKQKEEKPYKKYVGKLNVLSFKEVTEALEETEKVDSDEW
jgi:predicted HicB family RNase H-like nuclease